MIGKAALSLAVLAASGGYVWLQHGQADTTGLLMPETGGTTGSIAPEPLPASATPETPAPQLVPFVPPETAPAPPAAPAAPAPQATAAPLAADPPPLPQPDQPAQVEPPAPAPQAVPVSQPARAFANVPVPRPRPAMNRFAADGAAFPAPIRVASTASAGTYADGAYTGPVTDAYYGLMQIQAIVQGGRLTGIRVLQYPSDRRTSVFINRQALPMLRDEVISAQSASVDIISGATLSSEAFIRSLGGALDKARSTT